MDKPKNKIRVILSDEAEKVLESILKKFNLEEKNVATDRLIKNFVRGQLSENDFSASLEKDLSISKSVSEELSRELKNKLAPMLEKIPEENFKNFDFREEISQKIFTTDKLNSETPTTPNMPAFFNPEESKKLLHNDLQSAASEQEKPVKKQKPPKAVESVEIDTDNIVPKKPARPKSTGPDKYRESIE